MSIGLNRRGFFRGSGAVALWLAAGPSLAAGPAAAGKIKTNQPDYLRVDVDGISTVQDWQRHVLIGKGAAGEDYVFADGMPMVGSCMGETIVADDLGRSAGKEILLNYGVVQLMLGHHGKLFVRGNSQVDRTTCLGTQGSSGFGATASHVHMTVFGNMALSGDPFFDQLDDLRFRDDEFDKWNHVIDPKKLCARRGRPLFERPYNAESDADFDREYLEFVDQNIGGAGPESGANGHISLMAGSIYGQGDGRRPGTDELNNKIRDQRPLIEFINESMRRHETLTGFKYHGMPAGLRTAIDHHVSGFMSRASQDDYRHLFRDDASLFQGRTTGGNGRVLDGSDMIEAKWLGEFYETVRQAGRLIRLTSPFIDHTNPQAILAVAEANSEPVRKLIFDQRYYGGFLPEDMIPEEYRGRAVEFDDATRVRKLMRELYLELMNR